MKCFSFLFRPVRVFCFFFFVLGGAFSLSAQESHPPSKKLLFIMDKMNAGGTERSLVNLINHYPDKSARLYIYLLSRGGALESLLKQNPQVRLIDKTTAYKTRFDVVISYAPWIDVSLWINAIQAKRRIQWIHTDHAYFNRLARDMKSKSDLYQKIDEFLCVSHIASSQFRKRFPQLRGKVHTVYNIFDNASILEQAQEVPTDMRMDDGLMNVVTVARLSPEKNIDKAIELHKNFEKNGIYFRWYIIGEGKERQKLEQLIQEAGLEERFILLGYRKNPYSYMKAADIFALLSSSEGFGMVVTEAKVLQKPILVTDFPAVKEQIEHGVNGLVVQQDFFSLYAGLEQLLLNQDLRTSLVTSLEGFTIDNDYQYKRMQRYFFGEE